MTKCPIADLTCDALFDGALRLWQSKRGYRFGIDAVLLATDLPDLDQEATVVDLGAGQGAVALTIAHQHRSWQVIAVERQPSLVAILRKNVAENELDNVRVIEGDLRDYRQLLSPHTADLVVTNPPYYPKGSRRPSTIEERAAAHHELHGELGDFVDAAAYVLHQRGWLQLIAPPIRLAHALDAASNTDLRPASLRFYHSRATDAAYLFEGRWRRGAAPDMTVRPPLVIYDEPRRYGPEVARRLGREQR